MATTTSAPTSTHGPSEGANARLLEAIEANNLDAVREAISDGADVRLARKRITLVVHIDGKVNAESAFGEGAMTLAIRSANFGIVEAVLEAGEDDYDYGLRGPKFLGECFVTREEIH
ncbi:hypothetical protein M427DRAFT_181535 [Gonapodya prolifera JEL478]|uniref:Ankyrin n=1 Tax=Gonapodya prolifera (strain JEL478) TaxID=1344416 RepID=A0A139AQV2_GONPJ|nr:hypothetical protein M427DRAFT_181535 [Gonapodya prolifera JEL478]|eukprot:KXS19034.1 hypothetical protein M427DRAFT_181535 [Gonapodya prolifera JEL478]